MLAFREMLVTCSELVDVTFKRTLKIHEIKIVLVILFVCIHSCIHHSCSNEEGVVGRYDLFRDALSESIYTDLSKAIDVKLSYLYSDAQDEMLLVYKTNLSTIPLP